MKLEIVIIREALDIIENNATDKNTIIEQCNLILKYTREMKKNYENRFSGIV